MGVRYFGAEVRRIEDPKLLIGQGRYVDDLEDSGRAACRVRALDRSPCIDPRHRCQCRPRDAGRGRGVHRRRFRRRRKEAAAAHGAGQPGQAAAELLRACGRRGLPRRRAGGDGGGGEPSDRRGRRRAGRGRVRAAAGRDRLAARARSRRAAGAARRDRQRGRQPAWPFRRGGRRVRRCGACVPRALRDASRRLPLHGVPRRGRHARSVRRRTDGLDLDPGAAHGAAAAGRASRPRRTQCAGRRAGRGRRLRAEMRALPGGGRGPACRDVASAAGEMDRGPARAFPLDHPAARPGLGPRGRGRRAGPAARRARTLRARQRRLCAVRADRRRSPRWPRSPVPMRLRRSISSSTSSSPISFPTRRCAAPAGRPPASCWNVSPTASPASLQSTRPRCAAAASCARSSFRIRPA